MDKDTLLNLYRTMLVIRRFEEACLTLYQQGLIRGSVRVGGTDALRSPPYDLLELVEQELASRWNTKYLMVAALSPYEFMGNRRVAKVEDLKEKPKPETPEMPVSTRTCGVCSGGR